MTGDSRQPTSTEQGAEDEGAKKPLEGRGADAARHADGATMAAIEKRRTNRSSGSLAEEQERSIEIHLDDGQVTKREKGSPNNDAARLDAIQPTPTDTTGPTLKAGLVYSENPIKNTGVKNMDDVEKKLHGAADGLAEAMMHNLAEMAKDPNATHKSIGESMHKLGEAAGYVVDKIAKQDWQGLADDATKEGNKIVEASNRYSAMTQYDQGKFIGKEVMPNFVPELPEVVREISTAKRMQMGAPQFYEHHPEPHGKKSQRQGEKSGNNSVSDKTVSEKSEASDMDNNK